MRVFYFCGLRRFSVGIMVGEGRERCVWGDCSIILKFLSVVARLGRTRAADGSRGGTTLRRGARGGGVCGARVLQKALTGRELGCIVLIFRFDTKYFIFEPINKPQTLF